MPLPLPRDLAALHLAAIVRSSDDAIVSKDLNGIITSWNPAAERMFGYTAEEAVGRSILLIIPKERWSEEDEVLRHVRSGRSIEHFDTVRQRKDGSLIDISLTVSPIRDETGKLVGASKIARDVTDRKRAEAALRDLQRRLVTLVEASSSLLETLELQAVLSGILSVAHELVAADGYALWRANGDGTWRTVRTLGVSEQFAARILEARVPQQRQELAFTEPLVVEDVQAAPLLEPLRETYRAEGVSSMLVFPLRVAGHASGTLVFYSRERRRFSDVEMQTGQALANLAATAITTTELYEQQRHYREAAEQDRQRSAFLASAGATLSASLDYEKTLAAVANLAVPAIADWCAVDIVDDAGRVQRLAVAHVDPEKIQLAHLLQERYPEDPDRAGGVLHVIRTGRPAIVPVITQEMLDAVTRDEEHGRLIAQLQLASYICVPLMARGRAVGAITFAMAQSSRHYTEEDLALASEVAVRASLAVENARAYSRANDANRLKDEFLATLSHELRTPLSAILGYTLMLRLGKLPREQHGHALEVVERNAMTLKQMIDDVLDVSRVVAGKLRLSVQPVSLAQVLADAATTVLPAADAKGVRLQTAFAPFDSLVSGDRDRLQQVVWNLLSNSVKFTPRGGRVELRLEQAESQAQIVVSDTGIGISPEFLPHVFERFRQADSRFAREHAGLGIGLAIVREIVEMHGGTVSAESEGPGKGARFLVKLPIMAARPDRLLPSASTVEGPVATAMPALVAAAPQPLTGTRVVIVDDEEDALNLLRSILQSAGADVRTSRSASEALALLEAETADVLVSDIGMPSTDGLELIRRVRGSASAAVRDVPALALTAYARTEDRVGALSAGFQMHVAKPADPVELVLGVASLARRSREDEAGPPANGLTPGDEATGPHPGAPASN